MDETEEIKQILCLCCSRKTESVGFYRIPHKSLERVGLNWIKNPKLLNSFIEESISQQQKQ